MLKLGDINGYEYSLFDEEDIEKFNEEALETGKLSETDFGHTDFARHEVLINNKLRNKQAINTFFHEICHTYLEKWGVDNMFTPAQKELLCQFFGSTIQDLMLNNSKEINRIVSIIALREGVQK